MIKSYSEYIKEHFGAVTIEYPIEDTVVRNPSMPQQLAINTHVGGVGRIPMHWNNSPYLSGGFGGSGYGRFGQDPDSGKEDISNIIQLNQEIDTEIDNKLKSISDRISISQDMLSDTKFESICSNMIQQIESGKLDLVDDDTEGTINDELLSLDIQVEVETIKNPEEGDQGDYWTPPSGDDPGEYLTIITGPSNSGDEKKFEDIFNIKSLNDLPDLDDISMNIINSPLMAIAMNKTGLNRYGVVDLFGDVYDTISSSLEERYEQLDEVYLEIRSRTVSSMLSFDELVDGEVNIGVFLYLMLFIKEYKRIKNEQSLKTSLSDLRNALFNRKYRSEDSINKSKEVERIVSMVINIPDTLKYKIANR